MRKSTLYTVLLAVILAFAIVVGCAETSKKQSGFFKDYPPFKPGKEGVDWVYIKEGSDFKQYKNIMLDQVVFYFKEDTENKGINPNDIIELTEAFQKAFVDALNDAYPLTDQPGPGVLRVRIAITDIEPSSSGVGTTGIGSASMEAELLDSMSNERIGAAIDKDPGGKLDLGKLTPAKKAFEFWAKRLRAFLDDVHGVE
jgi:hypothetical protein